MVFDAKDQYPSLWAAIKSIVNKIGCTAETLRGWVRQGERDIGRREGPTTAEQQWGVRTTMAESKAARRHRKTMMGSRN